MSNFNVGDVVRVVKDGQCYVGYRDFMKAYARNYLRLWSDWGGSCRNGDAGRVVAMHENPSQWVHDIICVVKKGERVFMIGESGLELVTRAAEAGEMESKPEPEETTTITCENCGAVITDIDNDSVEINGEWYCDAECAENAGYVECVDCGEWNREDDARYIEDYGYVCTDCYDDGDYHECDDCGNYCRDRSMHSDNSNTYVCNDCYDSHWYTCANCGELVRVDNSYSYNGDYYCLSCYEDIEVSSIHDYNYKPSPIFCGDGDLYMGIELEVDDGDNKDDTAETIQENDMLYCKHDGSLHGDGIEIVSHPATLAYHVQRMNWERAVAICRKNDYKSHDTGTCGLHVHVNRTFFGNTTMEQDLNIAKVILIVNRFWDSHIVPFSRRNIDKLMRWANKSDLSVTKDDTPAEICSKVRGVKSEGRYRAINLQNTHTVEFRLFRGTLKLSTLYATFQFVDTLCRFAKNIELKDIDTLAWNDIFADVHYAELTQYLADRFNKKDEDGEELCA